MSDEQKSGFVTVVIPDVADAPTGSPQAGVAGHFLTTEHRFEKTDEAIINFFSGMVPNGTKIRGRLIRTGWTLAGEGKNVVEFKLV